MTPDDAVAHLAGTPRLLVALDFDGTLSPLVDEPMAARMTPDARAALDALAVAPDTTVALVSGRTLHDLRIIAEHGDGDRIMLVGSHGAEQWPALATGPSDPADAADAADGALRDELLAELEDVSGDAGGSGAWVEPKAFGFALHTRLATAAQARDLQHRVEALMSERASHWRHREGHDVREYSFRHDGKDGAVARLRAQTDATAVLFAGDDVTDEDALRSLGPQDVGVHVGKGATAASVRVEGISELAAMLVRLAHERAPARE